MLFHGSLCLSHVVLSVSVVVDIVSMCVSSQCLCVLLWWLVVVLCVWFMLYVPVRFSCVFAMCPSSVCLSPASLRLHVLSLLSFGVVFAVSVVLCSLSSIPCYVCVPVVFSCCVHFLMLLMSWFVSCCMCHVVCPCGVVCLL